MARTGINLNFSNSTLGQAQSVDGICMLVVHAVAVSTTFLLNTTYTLSGLSSLTALGITSTYDTTNSTTLYRQIKEFYEIPGNSGASLYLVGVAIGASTMSTFIGSSGFKTLLKQTGYSDDQVSPNSLVKFIGVSFSPQSTPTVSPAFFGDVIATRNALQLCITQLKAEIDPTVFIEAILDGNNCFPLSTGTPPVVNVTALPDQSTVSCNFVSFAITTAFPDSCASVGQVLGILAQNIVSYNLGNVQFGILPNTNAYFTDGTSVTLLDGANFNSIALKQYLFMRTWPQTNGFYYNDAPTCDLPQLALSNIQNNRVANKLLLNAQAYFTTLINTSVQLDANGNIPQSILNGYGASYTSTFIQSMLDAGEISQFGQTIVNNAPNFATTKQITVTQQFIPIGSIEFITVNAVFTQTITI